MHELGLCTEMVRTLEDLMKEEGIKKISKVCVDVGEITGVLPRCMEECWGPACEGSPLEGAKLKINFLPAKAVCRRCGEAFHPEHGKGACPKCGSELYDLENGFEFEITEISGE